MTRPSRRARPPMSNPTSPLREFLHTEAAGGALLVIGAAAALIWANSPWSSTYETVWNKTVSITVAQHSLSLDLREWVNQGLITIFFLVVGLEIKRELVQGMLATKRAALLPVVAAVGGMAAPALIYLAIAGGSTPRGWAIVVATDIPLALGVLALAGNRVSPGLRVFLLAVAIVDDIGSLLIIAALYSAGVGWVWLLAGVGEFAVAVLANRLGVRRVPVYVVLGCILWLLLHEAGVSATLAGVAMGLLAPTSRHPGRGSVTVVEWLEHVLHPWASYAIVPVFALANTGITLSSDLLRSALHSRLAWAIIVARVVGKPLGIVVATKATIGARWADRPGGASRAQLLGVAASAGMGFTVALFVTELALPNHAERANATLAIIVSALLAGTASLAILGLRRGEAA